MDNENGTLHIERAGGARMPESTKRPSVLAARIEAGKADPIRPEEIVIVAGPRRKFYKKYGRQGGRGFSS